MRIISGLFRGKKIFEPKNKITRPLKDLTKESIFNIINHSNKFEINLNQSNVLDLFSGIGSFGIECLSRGAEKVFFVENYSKVLPILKRNLSMLKNINNYKIIEHDIYDKKTFLNLNEKFDIIFLDPPFKSKELEKIFSNINIQKILKKNGIIILHRHKNENDFLPAEFKIIEQKIYGLSKIYFINNLD